MKQDYVTVDFKSKYGEFSIKLYGRFTCIIGLESGEGKSKLLDDLLNKQHIKETSITNDRNLPYEILGNTPNDVRSYAKNTILIMDEVSTSEGAKVLDMCKVDMYFIMICRSMPIKNTYPICGIYHLSMVGEWYAVEPHKLKLYPENLPIDSIVTEAEDYHSEHELVSKYFPNVISAHGRDKVTKGIRKAWGNILVFADLCNIGKAYQYWLAIQERQHNVYFYDYQSFEQLLYVSPLVQQRCGEIYLSSFSCNTLETYYNMLLEQVTNGTELEYHHGEHLAEPYLDKANFNKIFDSEVGRALIPLLSGNNSSSFDAVAYLQNKAGDKFEYFTQLQIDNCKTQDDCDELLQSLHCLD